MKMSTHIEARNFADLIDETQEAIQLHSSEVSTDRWQGWDIKGRPDYITHELLNFSCHVPLYGEELSLYQHDIKANLPWADDHFLERVGGHPINPGVEWANWPWSQSAAQHLDKKFNHNYMERLWPKFAGLFNRGTRTAEEYKELMFGAGGANPLKGIYHEYGDLNDLVKYLIKEPTTRQAYIPLFFPEDTGWGDGGRKPCTLGYQFIVRNKQLHIYYPMRSCDFVRHFRDDIYLGVRLLLWVLDRCREADPETWNQVTPGSYSMHCTSLHIFTNDWIKLFGKARGK